MNQTVPGQIANFNMWQREMTLDELNLLTCGTEGDVVSWNTLQEEGVSNRTEKEFTACNGKQFFKLFFKMLPVIKIIYLECIWQIFYPNKLH